MSTDRRLPLATTLRVRDRCLCLHAQRAARALARRFDDALRPLHLTSWQFSLLMALNRPLAPRMSEVAALLAIDRSTLTANLKPLVRRGLAQLQIDSSDLRSRRVVLSRAGRNLLAEAMPLWERGERESERLVADPDRLRSELRALGGEPAL